MARTKQTARKSTGTKADPTKNFAASAPATSAAHRVSTTGKGTSTSLYQADRPKPVTAPKPEVSDETDKE